METLTTTSTIETTQTLRVIPLESNLSVFQLTSKQRRVSSKGSLKSQRLGKTPTLEGFIDDDNLTRLKAGKAWERRDDLYTFLQEGQEMVRQYGYPYTMDEKTNKKVQKFILENPFSAFEAGEATLDDIVIFSNDSHMLFDRNEEALPVAMAFDYISNGRISDGTYDLEKLAAHLLKRDDITIFPAQDGYRRDSVDGTKRATTVDSCIVDIPYYNADNEARKTVYFRWTPTKADYQKLWIHCQKLNKDYPSTAMHQAAFDLDILGLRAAGIAHCDTYWGTRKLCDC